jgi:hypothetical protein
MQTNTINNTSMRHLRHTQYIFCNQCVNCWHNTWYPKFNKYADSFIHKVANSFSNCSWYFGWPLIILSHRICCTVLSHQYLLFSPLDDLLNLNSHSNSSKPFPPNCILGPNSPSNLGKKKFGLWSPFPKGLYYSESFRINLLP